MAWHKKIQLLCWVNEMAICILRYWKRMTTKWRVQHIIKNAKCFDDQNRSHSMLDGCLYVRLKFSSIVKFKRQWTLHIREKNPFGYNAGISKNANAPNMVMGYVCNNCQLQTIDEATVFLWNVLNRNDELFKHFHINRKILFGTTGRYSIKLPTIFSCFYYYHYKKNINEEAYWMNNLFRKKEKKLSFHLFTLFTLIGPHQHQWLHTISMYHWKLFHIFRIFFILTLRCN